MYDAKIFSINRLKKLFKPSPAFSILRPMYADISCSEGFSLHDREEESEAVTQAPLRYDCQFLLHSFCSKSWCESASAACTFWSFTFIRRMVSKPSPKTAAARVCETKAARSMLWIMAKI